VVFGAGPLTALSVYPRSPPNSARWLSATGWAFAALLAGPVCSRLAITHYGRAAIEGLIVIPLLVMIAAVASHGLRAGDEPGSCRVALLRVFDVHNGHDPARQGPLAAASERWAPAHAWSYRRDDGRWWRLWCCSPSCRPCSRTDSFRGSLSLDILSLNRNMYADALVGLLLTALLGGAKLRAHVVLVAAVATTSRVLVVLTRGSIARSRKRLELRFSGQSSPNQRASSIAAFRSPRQKRSLLAAALRTCSSSPRSGRSLNVRTS
jgi:hypothetical protein